jgi:DNA-binding transcriptional ArsR family regulator
MSSNAKIAEVAALAGDPARASMLQALMGGRALTATELARIAGITPQTGSGHLSRMVETGFLCVEKQGRHRYHRLASPAIARMIETMMQVTANLYPPRKTFIAGPRDAALRRARTCYDHLAGKLGVALTDAMTAQGYAELTGEAGLVTDAGIEFLGRSGIDLDELQGGRSPRSNRILCRPCLDWSERRSHLAGALGAAICTRSFGQGWIRRIDGTRAVRITPKGARAFQEVFGVDVG